MKRIKENHGLIVKMCNEISFFYIKAKNNIYSDDI